MTNDANNLKVGDRVRIVKGDVIGSWKSITSISDTFVCLDSTPPVTRRGLENLIAAGSVEVAR